MNMRVNLISGTQSLEVLEVMYLRVDIRNLIKSPIQTIIMSLLSLRKKLERKKLSKKTQRFDRAPQERRRKIKHT